MGPLSGHCAFSVQRGRSERNLKKKSQENYWEESSALSGARDLFPVVHWAPWVVGVKSVTGVWVANELKGLASAWVQAARPAEVLTAGGRRGGKVDMARGTWRQS